jgi:hypothetical protein
VSNIHASPITPTYIEVCLAVANELLDKWGWVPLPGIKIVIYSLALSGFGHVFASVGRTVWYSVLWRYPYFFLISLGFWPRGVASYYNFKKKYEDAVFDQTYDTVKKDPFKDTNFVLILESTLAPRAVMWQLVPGLTFLSQYAIMTAGNPFIDPQHYMDEDDKITTKVRKWFPSWSECYASAYDRMKVSMRCVDDYLEDQIKWTVYCDAIALMTAESRFIQLLLGQLKFFSSVAILYIQDIRI